MGKEEIEIIEESEWDIKKIIIGIVCAIAVIIGGYYIKQTYFPSLEVESIDQTPYSEVRGAYTEDTENFPDYSYTDIPSEVQKQITSLSQQVNNLNPAEVATSSPQVQKVLDDLKKLEQYPKSQAKEMCLNICKGL